MMPTPRTLRLHRQAISSIAWLCFFLTLSAFSFPGFSKGEKESKPKKEKAPSTGAFFEAGKAYDIVLEVVPINVRSLDGKTVVDVIEKDIPAGAEMKVVQFQIRRIFKGAFAPAPKPRVSKWAETRKAASEHKFLKMVTLDFENPDEEEAEKKWLSVAVSDPAKALGLKTNEGGQPEKMRIKLYLTRVPGEPFSYYLAKAVTS